MPSEKTWKIGLLTLGITGASIFGLGVHNSVTSKPEPVSTSVTQTVTLTDTACHEDDDPADFALCQRLLHLGWEYVGPVEEHDDCWALIDRSAPWDQQEWFYRCQSDGADFSNL